MAAAGSAGTSDGFAYTVKEINVPNFRQLAVDARLDVVLMQNDRLETVYLEGDERLFDYIKVFVQEGRLIIRAETNHSLHGKLQLTVLVRELNQVRVKEDSELHG